MWPMGHLFFVFLGGGGCVSFYFGFFAELFTLMRAIILRITRVFSKARLQMEMKTCSLFATRIALVDIY